MERIAIPSLDRIDAAADKFIRMAGDTPVIAFSGDLGAGKTTFIQIVVPSRVTIPEYQQLRTEIEQIVSNINGRFTNYGWVPIQYIFRSIDRYQLLAHYRCAEIALVTPLNSGLLLTMLEVRVLNSQQKDAKTEIALWWR